MGRESGGFAACAVSLRCLHTDLSVLEVPLDPRPTAATRVAVPAAASRLDADTSAHRNKDRTLRGQIAMLAIGIEDESLRPSALAALQPPRCEFPAVREHGPGAVGERELEITPDPCAAAKLPGTAAVSHQFVAADSDRVV